MPQNGRPSFEHLCFVASDTPEAQEARTRLVAEYGNVDAEDADTIVALGGDGLMLQTLHRFINSDKPIYGLNCGSVGFLMNEFRVEGLRERLADSVVTALHPLAMEAKTVLGDTHLAHAFNEVSMMRQTYQAAKLRISIDDKVRLEEMSCDGVLVATPAGSTAYNLSAHGPILPIHVPLLAVTPISAFRPRGWRGAVIPDRCSIVIDVLEHQKRPVSVAADHQEVRDVLRVAVKADVRQRSLILFDRNHGWEERVLTEQSGLENRYVSLSEEGDNRPSRLLAVQSTESTPMSKPSDAPEYIEAKNDLRKKVREIRRRSPADDPVKRAEAALQILSTHFDDWMLDEVKTMFATRDAWAAADYREGEEKRAFHRAVHDIKGQSTTLGFPLATRVAGSLCSLLERVTERALTPVDLVNQHVDSIRAIVRERAKDEQNRVGSALTQTLLDVTEAYIARHGHIDEEDDGVIIRDL